MSNPSPSPAARAASAAATRARAAAERAYRFEEARRLMSWGVDPDCIAKQLDCTRDAIERQAHRWGERDIAAYFRQVRHVDCTECGRPSKSASGLCRSCWQAERMARGWNAGRDYGRVA